MTTWMTRAFLLVLGCLLAMSGVVFRSFWLSEWGPITFIFLVWLTMSVVFGWKGKGKPYSIRFGLICGSGIALGLLATFYINSYVGIGLLLALIYLGVRTKFFERRWAE
ncbi:hypothetical protein LJR245_000792 [Rhizobium leguminosarum]|uniref:hypothetical protein n=1 Tax=Rhizobium leguminosarum TaxID=384 RepID=UPI003ED01A69